MSTIEILVIVGGLIFGYWVVSLFTGEKRPANRATPVAGDGVVEPEESQWHDVLQLPPSATLEDIRAAYQNLISQYHPDKVASLGIELRALADKKSKQINAAYQEALRSRGQQP